MPIAISFPSPRVIIAAAALLSGACSGGEVAAPTVPEPIVGTPAVPVASANVAMSVSDDGYGSSSNSFVPREVYIVRNGSVTWNNGTGINHNVNFAGAAGAPANVATFSSGAQQRMFPTSGTYDYSCTLHAGMTGVVRVQ